MHPPTPSKASHRALFLPEILTEIIAWIHADTLNTWPATRSPLPPEITPTPSPSTDAFTNPITKDRQLNFEDGPASDSKTTWDEDADEPETTCHYTRTGALYRCALVNRPWSAVTLPVLWSEDLECSYSSNDLPDRLARIADPARRQVYAAMVTRARLVTVSEPVAQGYGAALREVEFPRLESVTLVCPGAGGGELSYVPPVRGGRVRVLEIDPRFESWPDTYCVRHAEWEALFGEIPTIFPNVETVVFKDRARVFPGALERFAERLSALKRLDRRLVIENEDIYSPG
ncbi:hypothetical protein ASPACDRAFT_1853986 [Aspergillus aculeatus ATCC 16872]|uniref:Uncharacterized protein n=1 Tax=Aspergillus aculeatus (strain ATCC 16872 / CBS 172.66 / WB 5094) TaxID=690307 RepID=A0A1L9X0Z0_ASPA1|nr:uncharacterized protein ASPACDRAFT_1853986 [Aspergillus aculeatus ATCC 16872]OJK01959.1 hypothetical protein ASPACDRAFT_1853986 [Aspergillus aculeatus ATCC 16872]